MASGQNPWEGQQQPPRSIPSSSSSGSNGANEGENNRASESIQIQKKFFVSSVSIPFIYNGPPSNVGGSSSQPVQVSESTRQDNSARPALTLATPVIITTSQPTGISRVTNDQRDYLESIFKKRQSPEKDEIREIATRLSLSEQKVRNWFSNRRYKAKREAAEVPLQMPPPSHTTSLRTTSSATIAPQTHNQSIRNEPSQNEPTRNVTQTFASTASTSSEREETSSADGILGSGSIKYRPPTIQARSLSSSKSLFDKAPSNKGDSSNQMTASEIRSKLFPMMRGGSIAYKEHVPELARLVLMAGDSVGRKYIINTLSYTKDQKIHDEFAKTPALARVVEWIKEGRKEIDIMEDPYDGEHQPKEVVQIVVNAIKTLSRAPLEYRPLESSRLIKHLTNNAAYPEEIVRAASELLADWSRTGDRHNSRSASSQSLVDGRKRARMDAGSTAGASEPITQLPNFIKKSSLAASSRNITSSSSASSSSASSSSSALVPTSSSTLAAKGGQSARRMSSTSLSVLTGKNLPPKPTTTATSVSPISAKAGSSPRQLYSPRGPVQSPRSAQSPRTAQSASSSSTSDIVLGRQLDFFSSISAPLNAAATASIANSSASTAPTAPTTSTTANTTTSASTTTVLGTNTTTATASSSGTTTGAAATMVATRSHIVAPSGRMIPSALILKPGGRRKKVVRFRGGNDIEEVRIFHSEPDEHRTNDYGDDDRNDDRRDDWDDGDGRDSRVNWGNQDGHYRDEEEERRGRMEYEDDRDRYYQDDRYVGGYDHGPGYDQEYHQGYPEGYEHGRGYRDEHGYEHRYDHDDHPYNRGYEQGHGHGREHEYDYEYRHEQEQLHQQQQQHLQQPQNSYQYLEPTLEPAPQLEEPAVPEVVSAVPAFRLPEEDVEKLVRGELWRPIQKLLIEHPEDTRHVEPVTFGGESKEKLVQAEREATVPAVHYPDLASIPSTPAEPDDDEDMEVDPRPKRKIELYEIQAPLHTVALPMLSLLLQVIQARRKEMES